MRWILVACFAVAATLGLLAVVGAQHMARAASLPACSGDQVAGATTDARHVHGDVVGVTAMATWGTVRCVLRERLTFAVKPASDRMSTRGAIASVGGNPARKLASVVLRPGDVVVYSWHWQNWCGPPGRYVLQAFWSGSAYTAPTPSQSVKPPTCAAKGSHSTLSETRPSITACSPSAYRIGAGEGQPFMTRLIEGIGITLRKHRRLPCLLRHRHVTLVMQGKSGGDWVTLTQVVGNPGSRTVGTMLTLTYGGFEVLWAWSNWCGGGNRFRTYATVGKRAAVGPTETQGATCEGQGSPSMLTASYGHA